MTSGLDWLGQRIDAIENAAKAIGRIDERERIIQDVTNASTEIADAYKLGDPEKAFYLLLNVIRGENK